MKNNNKSIINPPTELFSFEELLGFYKKTLPPLKMTAMQDLIEDDPASLEVLNGIKDIYEDFGDEAESIIQSLYNPQKFERYNTLIDDAINFKNEDDASEWENIEIVSEVTLTKLRSSIENMREENKMLKETIDNIKGLACQQQKESSDLISLVKQTILELGDENKALKDSVYELRNIIYRQQKDLMELKVAQRFDISNKKECSPPYYFINEHEIKKEKLGISQGLIVDRAEFLAKQLKQYCKSYKKGQEMRENQGSFQAQTHINNAHLIEGDFNVDATFLVEMFQCLSLIKPTIVRDDDKNREFRYINWE